MVQYRSLSRTFAALADPTRREILERLSAGPASTTDLAEPFGMSLPGMLKHIRVLEDAGLVTTWKDGRTRACQLGRRPLEEASEWIESSRRRWEGRTDRMERYIARRASQHESRSAD